MSKAIDREVITDPLAPNPNSNASVRQLGQGGVTNPRQSGGTGYMDNQNAISQAISKISSAMMKKADIANDEAVTEGRLSYLQGATQADMVKNGNKYNMQGWQSLNAVDQANSFIASEKQSVADGGYMQSPEEYKAGLMTRRAELLEQLPDDPVARKSWAAAFDNTSSQLIVEQSVAHNEYNKLQTEKGVSNQLRGGPLADPNAHRVMPGSNLKVSPGQVSTPLKTSAYDRDVGIRTILGEAGGEGAEGMAAVAHNLKNRTHSGKWGSTLTDVALAEKQYSAWNSGAGGVNPHKYDPNSNAYKRAGEIFDAVMSGKHADNTGGYLNYFSPQGMNKLVAEGSQKNLLPKGYIGKGLALGNHVFWGEKLDGAQAAYSGGEEVVRQPTAISGSPQQELGAPAGTPPDMITSMMGTQGQRTGTMTQSQDFLLNSPVLPPLRKAELAADVMIDELLKGNDIPFREMGGIASLQQLGLDDANIGKVQDAHTKFKKGKADEFNLAHEQQKYELMEDVRTGRKTIEEAGPILDKWTEDGILSEDGARAFVQSYFASKGKGDFIENPQLQADMADLHLAVMQDDGAEGGITLGQAVAKAQELGVKYGVPPKKMEGYTQELVNLQKSKIIKAREELKKTAKSYAENQKSIAAAQTAISTGYGIGALNGTIDVTMEDGDVKKVPATQWAISQIKQSVIREAQTKARKGDEASMASASVWADREIHRRLKKQAVVDNEQKVMITTGLSGNVIGADGKVTQDALLAAEWFVTVSKDSSIGPEYAIQYAANEDAKALALEINANMLPGLSLEDQIFKANAKLNAVSPVDTSGNNEFITRLRIADRVAEAVGTITDTSAVEWQGWIQNMTGIGKLDSVDPMILDGNKTAVSARVEQHARLLKANSPNLSEKAAIDGALAQTSNEGIMLGGHIYFGDPKQNKRLDQVMGTQGDKLGPQKAITHWVEKYYAQALNSTEDGKTILAAQNESWWETTKRVAGGAYDVSTAALQAPAIGGWDEATKVYMEGKAALSGPPMLPYNITVDERNFTAMISFYDPKDGKALINKKVNLSEIGQAWKEDTQNDATLLGRITNSVLRTLTTDENE